MGSHRTQFKRRQDIETGVTAIHFFLLQNGECKQEINLTDKRTNYLRCYTPIFIRVVLLESLVEKTKKPNGTTRPKCTPQELQITFGP